MTGIFLGVFNVYGSSTYQILKDQQIEFTDILVEGDSLVLVRNEKNGFSSEGIYLGVYNCVERMWTVEYQAYDEYLESSYYAGDRRLYAKLSAIWMHQNQMTWNRKCQRRKNSLEKKLLT